MRTKHRRQPRKKTSDFDKPSGIIDRKFEITLELVVREDEEQPLIDAAFESLKNTEYWPGGAKEDEGILIQTMEDPEDFIEGQLDSQAAVFELVSNVMHDSKLLEDVFKCMRGNTEAKPVELTVHEARRVKRTCHQSSKNVVS
jgi:hypothetical protein